MHPPQLVFLAAFAVANVVSATFISPHNNIAGSSTSNSTASIGDGRLKRAPNDAEQAKKIYDKAVEMGEMYYDAIFQLGTAGQEVDSKKTPEELDEELKRLGWTGRPVERETDVDRSIDSVLRELRPMSATSHQLGQLIWTEYYQDQSYEVGKGEEAKKYPKINAKHKNAYGPGVIFSIDNVSLKHQLPADREPPRFTHWSDLAIMFYHHHFKDATLKAVVHLDITDDQATTVIQELKKDLKLPKFIKFPGHSFTPDQEGFKALLGTANGRGVAFLLHQRRPELDWLVVEEAILWTNEYGTHNIWFKIKRAPTNELSAGGGSQAESSKGGSKKQQKGKKDSQTGSTKKGASSGSGSGKGPPRGSRRSDDRAASHHKRDDHDHVHDQMNLAKVRSGYTHYKEAVKVGQVLLSQLLTGQPHISPELTELDLQKEGWAGSVSKVHHDTLHLSNARTT